MNGELAELICLAAHGSAWLSRSDDREDAPALDRENSTFQYVGSIEFRLAKSGWRHPQIRSGDVATWLSQLRRRGVRQLSLVIPEAIQVGVGEHQVDERMLVGFANAGRWSLLATGIGPSESWSPTWEVANRDAPDQRIWSVTYSGQRTGTAKWPSPEISAANEALDAAVRKARKLAAATDLDSWVEVFDEALSPGQPIAYHPDLLPAGYSAEARALMAKASRAWVFGGMGSWNDVWIGPDRQHEYDVVSSALYAAVIKGLVASTNRGLTVKRP